MLAPQTFVVLQQPDSTSPAVQREKLDYLVLSFFTSRSVPLENHLNEVFRLVLITLVFSDYKHNHRFTLSNQSDKVIEKFGQSHTLINIYERINSSEFGGGIFWAGTNARGFCPPTPPPHQHRALASCFLPRLKPMGFHTPKFFL